MDVKKVAEQILREVGGKENIESAAHCATRLRLVIKDQSKVQVSNIENIPEVKGSFQNAGQFQIILGTGVVTRVYAALLAIADVGQSSTGEAAQAAMKKLNPWQRLARVLSNVLVPIIPAIVASGFLMGLLGMLSTFQWINPESGIIHILNMFSNTAFIFLPVLIAFSAAREFGANPFLAAVLGGLLIHPDLQNAWTVGGGIKGTIDVFGLAIAAVGYQGTVLPVLIAVWFMAFVEKNIRKAVPNALDILLTPFLTLAISGFVALVAIGPFGRMLGSGISFGLTGLYSQAGPLAGLLFGGVYSAIVITGIHHSFHAIEMELIKNVGLNYLLPIWSMANVAQGGAALAVYFKTTDEKIKAIAIPAATSCLLGITEAAIFGVNIRLGKPFAAAAVGGALGGAYVVAMKVGMTAVGLTGIPGISIVQPAAMIHYVIGMCIAFGGAFAASWLAGAKESERVQSMFGKARA
ncbi:sucrose-specific PTS transporter subunit IIBC [Propionispora hippei]|uniref:PTS system, sucrose-specific IIC component n=1 Tax=Propionispora hippei DSM 15287 TaxID=1123003 RepID=A0A1M6G7L7_9FIRM|nr:sucrose-specific PTS transporter subunit IIBC [Propionispora hippei]SHJ05928.1 PTS system, sucrose-specific IIC component [Propionispora hippei DSM 15287]